MKRLLTVVKAALLLFVLVLGVAGTASAEAKTKTETEAESPAPTFESGLPACHIGLEDDGKPIKLALPLDGGSTGKGAGTEGLSGIWIAAIAAATVGAAAFLTGYLTFRIRRRRFEKR